MLRFRRVYIATFGFVLIAHIQAATVSQHNESHAGIQAAIDRLEANGCNKYQITRSGQYNLNDTPDATTYTLSGNTITIKCTRYAEPPVKPEPVFIIHDLTWQRPTTRTDGTPLPADQIQGYVLEIDGVSTNIGNVISYSATYSVAMIHTYRIATIDTDGQQGPWSEEVKF